MYSWLKTTLIVTGVAAVAVAAAYFTVPQVRHLVRAALPSSGNADFTKTAYDQNGSPITGPVSIGQIIQYVLRYKPPTSVSGAATITDVLSASQTYVPSSVNAPGWTLSTPVYNANQETYSMAAFGPTNFSMNIPAISGSAGAPGGGGDGYEPVPVLTSVGVKVFGVNHHQPYNGTPHIMCWLGASLAKCSPAYPMNTSTGPNRRATPDFPHAVVYQKKIYFPAGRYNDTVNTTLEFGLGCWDAEADTDCPFVSLPGQPSLNMAGNTAPYLGTRLDDYVAGVRADPANPSHLYVYATGNLYCVDISLPGAPACVGWTLPAIAPTTTSGARGTDMFVQEGGPRLFFSNSTVALRCFNLSNGATCSGWPAAGVNGGATLATNLGPGIDSSGNMNAICLNQSFTSSANFRCFSLTNGAVVTSWPASLASASVGIEAAYHIPGTAKVLFPPYSTAAGPRCFNFATNLPCTPFAPYWKSNASWSGNNEVADYGYAVDPQSPENCIYGLGDGQGGNGDVLVRFKQDGTAATAECAPKNYHANFSLNDLFCFEKPTDAIWTTIEIDNRPSTLIGGAITITNSSGTIIQTIPVGSANSYTLNISATGANGAVSVDFTPTYSGNTLPTTDYQIKLNYTTGEDSQICYQATVTSCGDVSNAATLKDDAGTLTAGVDLGDAIGGTCGPPPLPNCLILTPSVLMNPDGTGALTLTLGGPPGFDPKSVTVTSLTGGVVVTPATQTFGSGQTVGTWALSGLTSGMTAKFQIDAVDIGAGGKPGTDKCCSSTIQVTIPPPVVPTKVDVGLKKTGAVTDEDQMGPLGSAAATDYTFTLQASNLGAPINGQNAVVVTDVVPPGMIFAGASGVDWNCGPASQFPISGGGVLTCTYVGAGQLASGAALPPISVNAHVQGDPTDFVFLNCATIGLSVGAGYVDSNAANNKSCYGNGSTHGTTTQPPKSFCDEASTRTDADGDCSCRYPGMTQKTHTLCVCSHGQSLVAGLGCMKAPPACDARSTRMHGGLCECRYDGMAQTSLTTCTCLRGEVLVKGRGCVSPHSQRETPTPSTCPEGTTMQFGGACAPVCTDPMTLNAAHDACECPDGTELKNGKCVEKRSFFDKVFDNVHVGIGMGGGGGHSGGTGTPKGGIGGP